MTAATRHPDTDDTGPPGRRAYLAAAGLGYTARFPAAGMAEFTRLLLSAETGTLREVLDQALRQVFAVDVVGDLERRVLDDDDPLTDVALWRGLQTLVRKFQRLPARAVSSPPGLWITGDIAANGAALLLLQCGPDLTRCLDVDGARRFSRALLRGAARAEHDAAVLNQLTAQPLGCSDADAVTMLSAVRAGRPGDDLAATAPLRLVVAMDHTPGGNSLFRSWLKISAENREMGAWSTVEAQAAAWLVEQAAEIAALDADYYRYLLSQRQDDNREDWARNTVLDLDNFRALAIAAEIVRTDGAFSSP